MLDILLILYLGHILHISASKRIHCATTIAKKPNVNIVTCEPRVEYCLTILQRQSEDVDYVQQPFGCMTWDELVARCPSVENVCHILHGDYGRVPNTCCCRGNMCNNRTLRLVAVEGSNDAAVTQTGNLANFGIGQRNLDKSLHSSIINHSADWTVLIYTASIGAALLFVIISFFLALTIKYWVSESQSNKLYSFCVTRKRGRTSATTESGSLHEGKSHSVAAKIHRRGLIHRILSPSPTNTTTPLLMSDEALGTSISHLSSLPCDIPLYKLAYSSSFRDVANLHSAEKLAMQHIIDRCRKGRLLGHGRFAEVWLASIAESAIRESARQFQAVLRNATSETGGALASTGHSEQATDITSSSTALTGDKGGEHRELFLHYPSIPPTTVEGSSSDHVLRTYMSDPTEDETPVHMNPDHSNDVAIKIFPASEFKSWSAELAIFRALQETLADRLLSISSSHEALSLASLLCQTSETPSDVCVCPLACPTTTSNGTTTVKSSTFPENSGSNLSPSSQSRHVNLIQMIAAGVITEVEGHATAGRLLREYHLVLEYAAGGSLRNLLASCQWLSTSRVLQISRDIARGVSFLHSDVSFERSAARGSPAKLPIAHRDLKPDNILLRANGTACLSDFGQATMVMDVRPEYHRQCPAGKTSIASSSYWSDVLSSQAASQNPSTAVCYGHCSLDCMPQAGTLRYMAPELLDGAINFTGTSLLRTDIYSLALVIWEVMTAVYVPDHQQLVPRPGPSHDRQTWADQQQSSPAHRVPDDKRRSPARLSPSADDPVEAMLVGDLGAASRLAGYEVFGQGFRLLSTDLQGDNGLSGRPLQRQQHWPPPAPSTGVDQLRERHRLPYELELESAGSTAQHFQHQYYYQQQQLQQQQLEENGNQNSSSLLLRQLVVVDKYRPMPNYLWTDYTLLSQLYRTVTECWDPEPEARLTADCVLERINVLLGLLKRYSQPEASS